MCLSKLDSFDAVIFAGDATESALVKVFVKFDRKEAAEAVGECIIRGGLVAALHGSELEVFGIFERIDVSSHEIGEDGAHSMNTNGAKKAIDTVSEQSVLPIL